MTCYTVHEPFLDAKLQVVGYKFTWLQDSECVPDETGLEAMILAAAKDLLSSGNKWPLGDKQLFLEVTPGLLLSDSLKSLPAEMIVLSIDGTSLPDGEAYEAIPELRRLGFGISVCNPESASLENELLPHVTHLEFDCSRSNPHAASEIGHFRRLLPQMKILGRNIDTWSEYSDCRKYGLDIHAGDFYLQNVQTSERKSLNPAQTIILKCLALLMKNAEVGMIEKELKRDPAITYQLLRHMNTVGHGAGIEFASLRQAVNYLGYSNLNKWLCCVLAMSSTAPNASPVLETAMIRGLFMELLGRLRMTNNEADQLFITGIFSLLDRLLGIPMEEVLAEIPLSESIQGALLGRTGIYGRYLELARACEYRHGLASPIADSLRINVSIANAAHLRAMIWAQRIQ